MRWAAASMSWKAWSKSVDTRLYSGMAVRSPAVSCVMRVRTTASSRSSRAASSCWAAFARWAEILAASCRATLRRGIDNKARLSASNSRA